MRNSEARRHVSAECTMYLPPGPSPIKRTLTYSQYDITVSAECTMYLPPGPSPIKRTLTYSQYDITILA